MHGLQAGKKRGHSKMMVMQMIIQASSLFLIPHYVQLFVVSLPYAGCGA